MKLLASIDRTLLAEKEQETVALLALVAGQDVEPADGSDGTDGWGKIARRVAMDRVISTVDRNARHAHKSRQKKVDGFKNHIIIEPDTGLVAAAILTKAAGAVNSDVTRGMELVTADTSVSDQEVDVLGDSADGRGELLAAITADDITINETTNTVTCPAGQVHPTSATHDAPRQHGTRGFGVDTVKYRGQKWLSRLAVTPNRQ